MIRPFHPALPRLVRLEIALRLAWVRATVPRLPPPPGPQGVVDGEAPALHIVGIGDSIVAGIGVREQADGLVAQVATRLAQSGRAVRWVSIGLAGATAPALAALLEAAGRERPDLVLLSCGVNDIVRGQPAADFAAALEDFYRRAVAVWPAVRIVHAGIPPLERFPALQGRLGRLLGAHGDICIAAARLAAERSGVLYSPFPSAVSSTAFARDGFHPNDRGCAAWADSVAATITAGAAPTGRRA